MFITFLYDVVQAAHLGILHTDKKQLTLDRSVPHWPLSFRICSGLVMTGAPCLMLLGHVGQVLAAWLWLAMASHNYA